MKCRRCRAPNSSDSLSCWACGVRLQPFSEARRPRSMRTDAMRHYSAAPAAVIRHRVWIDGLVLLCTALFGLLAAYFILDVLPAGGSPRTVLASLTRLPNPMDRFLPAATVLPSQPVGVSQGLRGVVTQVAEPRWSTVEGGVSAGAGSQFFVVTAVIDNQSGQPVAYDLEDWKVLDSGGRVHDPERFRGTGWLSAGRIDPGQRVQGALAFLIPQGDAGQQLRFGPPGLRVVMLWDAVAPAPG